MPDAVPDETPLPRDQALQLLRDARQKAAALVDRLVQEQAAVEANPPSISPEAMTEGRAAMARAIDAARRTVNAIDAALSIPPDPAGGDPTHWN